MMKYVDTLLERKWNAHIAFLVSFLLMCLLYGYQYEVFARPHSYHSWRQADGFSVVYNYYEVSMNFFQPRISQFISQDGLELAEFPIGYYISALGYTVFGFHEWIPRVVHLSFIFFGLWCLYRLLADLLADHFYGIIFSLFLFTSPVLVFYSITPMPDVVGLSLSLAGLYYFCRYLRSYRAYHLILSFVFYATAGSVKPTSIISLLVIVVMYVYLCFIKKGTADRISRKAMVQIGCFSIATLTVIAGWWIYVSYYRSLHHTSYFQTNANPIWRATSVELLRTIKHFYVWMNHYYNWPAAILTVFLLCYSCRVLYRQGGIVFISYMIYLMGCIAYMLFFFSQFYFHDYYIIVILPLFVATLFLFLTATGQNSPGHFRSGRFKGAFLLFFLFNTLYTTYKIHERNTDPGFAQNDHTQLKYIAPYLGY